MKEIVVTNYRNGKKMAESRFDNLGYALAYISKQLGYDSVNKDPFNKWEYRVEVVY